MRLRLAVATCLVLSMSCLAGCAVDRAASRPTSTSRSTIGPDETTVRVLQLNLCNSGRAGCYSGGRAVGMASAIIHDDRPRMVSLNEVCRDDVRVLEHAMSATFHAAVRSAFAPAEDRPTHSPVRCQNGQEYGDGVLAVTSASARGFRSYSGLYPLQDPGDVEERVWVCLDLAARFAGCTTHTASTSTSTALDQCRYLLGSVVPRITRRDGGNPMILGADLNLAAHGSPSPQACLPRGYQRTDDNALQDVVVSPGIAVRSRSVVDMHGTTDHPGLLVEVALPR